MEDGCGRVVLRCRISTDSAEIFKRSLRNAVFKIQPQQQLCVMITPLLTPATSGRIISVEIPWLENLGFLYQKITF